MTAPAWLAAERSGSGWVGPGAGWDAPWLDGEAAPPVPPPAVRCGRCGYLSAARGHLVQCGPVTWTRRQHAGVTP